MAPISQALEAAENILKPLWKVPNPQPQLLISWDQDLLFSPIPQHLSDDQAPRALSTHPAPLTSSIQSMKAETRVNTVGFLMVLQPKAETKLVTPWTCQEPSAAGQLRGPPESPWNSQRAVGD